MTALSNSQQPNISQQQLGEYQLQKELGRNREGGRISYLANHPDQNQPVVLKQFRFAQTGASWSGFKSYEREIEILQAIAHSQVPKYLDSFETEDGFCMVQEYKAAPTLAERYHLTPKQVQQVATSVLTILRDLQQQVPPVIHRDIKPENILVDDTLQAYLIDFGLAKLNHESVAVSSIAAGTPGFMPPEEIFNRPLDTAADLYSVGATLVSLLTKVPPANISDLLDDHYRLNFQSRLPPVSPRFVQWLQIMVEPNPRHRFGHAAAALEALEVIDITNLSEQLPENYHSAQSPGQKIPRRHPVRWLSIAGTLVGLVPLVFNIAISNKSAPKVSPRAPSSAARAVTAEQKWFESIKPSCNPLEVVTAIQANPYPDNPAGAGLGASCYALAGKLALADSTIQTLPERSRIVAAQILFEISHPVADRGDDESAGPLMDLVLKYWPENYMARYHAGMSAYVLAENDKAIDHLEEFLSIYSNNDGWRQKALLAINNIQQGIPADDRFKFHH